MAAGDWARAAETLEREAGEHLYTAILQYRLACAHARLGDDERALHELHRAIDLSPAMRARAQEEESLATLRGLPGWPAPTG